MIPLVVVMVLLFLVRVQNTYEMHYVFFKVRILIQNNDIVIIPGTSITKALPKVNPSQKSDGPRRSLNLADYKKRRGLI